MMESVMESRTESLVQYCRRENTVIWDVDHYVISNQ